MRRRGREYFLFLPRLIEALSAATWVDRLHYITVPLLKNLAKVYDRPEIANPDLIEINSGYWDLRKYTEGESTGCHDTT